MPTDGAGPVLRMAAAVGIMSAVAGPAALIGWRLGRGASPTKLPTPGADDPVVALGYTMLFIGSQVLVAVFGQAAESAGLPRLASASTDADVQSTWRAVFGQLLFAPLMLVGWLAFRTTAGSGVGRRSAASAVAVGAAGWVAASGLVYALNALAEWLSSVAGLPPQEHSLVQVATTANGVWLVLLFVSVTAATPFTEEVLFRGALLGWLRRSPVWSAVPVGLGALIALSTTSGAVRIHAAGLTLILSAGLFAFRHRPTAAAVWATAIMFALVHSSIWPTPVPLFLLGLVLGWVAVRTGGVLAGTVLHGLFNAVSLVYLVRG